MAIFTIDKFTGGDIGARADYFERGEGRILDDEHDHVLSTGGEDYYHMPGNDTLLTEYLGQGAQAMGLGITPQNGDYAALMAGTNPRTRESYVPKRRQGELERGTGLAGYSTSFNADKTLSLVYASLPREQQIIFERAMMEASRRAFEYAEAQGYFGYRLGAQGVDRYAGKAMAASYLHFTNRNQEPHLHVHVEIPNACRGTDGQWRPLDGGELYKRQAELAALWDCYLAHALSRDIPQLAKYFEVDLERNGLRVAGISRETVLEFSTRRIEILKALDEMGASGADSARGAAKRTREGKKERDSDELRAEWREQLSSLHQELQRGDLSPETRLFAEQLVFRNSSVFGEHALDRAAAQLAILHGGEPAIPAIKSALIRQLGVVELPQEGRFREFTTETYRQLEGELLAYAHAAQKPQARFTLKPLDVEMAIARIEREKGYPMRDEQRAVVRLCTSGARVQIIQGAAGTGKSVSLSALREAYEAAGNRVIGLAPSGAAAAELQNSAGIQARTIHSLLMRLENDNAQYREKLRATDVIICDEAGLADLRTLHKLAGFCDAAGAKLILVGDGRQLEAVGSASSLDMLTEEVGCAELIQIARQKDPADRAVSQAWFEGPAEQGCPDALDIMKARGLLKMPVEGSKDKPLDLMMRDVLQARSEGTDWQEILLLADRNQSVRSLNNKIRDHRFEIGELDKAQQIRIPVETGRGDYADLDLVPGDRIMLRKNQKLDGEPVYNGDRANLTAIERVQTGTDDNGEPIYDTKITARLDRTKEEVSWNLSDYASIDHAYAMTVHKSQGLTVDRAFYLTSDSTDRRLAYVAYTRSRYACSFYTDNDQDSLDTLARNTEGFKSKRCALDADKEFRALIRANAEAGLYEDQPIKAQQPSTKDLLEKAGERFEYPTEPKAEPKKSPEIQVMPATQADHDLSVARGFAVTTLIDQPTDTRQKPGKPYELPANGKRVALLAEPLPLPPTPKQEIENERPGLFRADRERAPERIRELADAERAGLFAHHTVEDPRESARSNPRDGLRNLSECRLASDTGRGRKGLLQDHARNRGRAAAGMRRDCAAAKGQVGSDMAKPRRVWTKGEQQRETQVIRDCVELRVHAERLGYVQVSGSGARVRMENKLLDKSDPMREITLKPNAKGEPSWVATKAGAGSGLGGDVFHLHQHSTGQNFLETRDELRKVAFNKDFEAGTRYQGISAAESEARMEQQRQAEALKTEVRRAEAFRQYQRTLAEPNQFLLARGISEQTLAETKSRTDRHGNAVFPHVREDGKFTGFERKHDGPALFSKSQRGVYIANPGCEAPERIKVAEGGLDALSLYQLDTPEQRACTLYVSSGGNPADDTARALRGLADRTGARQVDLVYDRDEAGTRHTETLKQLLAEQAPGLQVADRRGDYRMADGEDPNDLLLRQQSQPQQAAPDQQAEAPQPPVAPKPATVEETQETPEQRRSM
ncbi:exonuclease V subunit alpha [Pseudomonas fluorescens NCIMB 11764]|uniref:Exonuclease V subunit alpha n=1 Tax=Pseudomonas fluorescens NCIMB 11764 TaxID=1221522 RepID=A0A0K1QKX7_PSEFL|nr:MobF family relaxase [Pseudomonas fluorescens]AKV06115.1 exonuclease V subunit alpha [Pseudomonas fluorescens NCIMB 11764]